MISGGICALAAASTMLLASKVALWRSAGEASGCGAAGGDAGAGVGVCRCAGPASTSMSEVPASAVAPGAGSGLSEKRFLAVGAAFAEGPLWLLHWLLQVLPPRPVWGPSVLRMMMNLLLLLLFRLLGPVSPALARGPPSLLSMVMH